MQSQDGVVIAMCRTSWSAAIGAIGVLLVGSLALAQERLINPVEQPPVVGFDIGNLHPEAKLGEKDDSKKLEREIRDLEAQEQMALWAERMFWATVVSIITSGLGILLVWRTLVWTNRGVEQNRRSNDLTEAHQRPWVYFDVELTGAPSLKLGMDMIVLPVNINIKNEGSHPAIDVDICWDVFETDGFDFEVEYKRIISESNQGKTHFDEPVFNSSVISRGYGAKIDRRGSTGWMAAVCTIFYKSPDRKSTFHTCIFYNVSMIEQGGDGDAITKIFNQSRII